MKSTAPLKDHAQTLPNDSTGSIPVEKNGAISPEKPSRPTPSPPLISTDDVSRGVLEIVSESTGYPEEFIEFDADMEGELGIDSIKQAEIMSEIRDRYSLPLDESFQLRDHPTIGHVIRYIGSFTDSNESLSLIHI